MSFAVDYFNSPLGMISIFEIDNGICALEWGYPPERIGSPFLSEVIDQMNEYFDGKRQKFEIQFKPAGTSFQQKIWAALSDIPFGQVKTYGEIAKQLNSSPRAVGMACGTNPIPILIPCHRVVASNMHLKGYSGEGGLETKKYLLCHEGFDVEEDKIITS